MEDEIRNALAIADSLQGDVEILVEAIANEIQNRGYEGNKEIIYDTIIRRIRRQLSPAKEKE